MLRVDVATDDLYDGTRRVVGLTPGQAGLARVLLSSPGETVPHATLLAVLGYRPDAQTRALHAAVSRLRRVLPGTVWTRHRVGYRWEPPRMGAESPAKHEVAAGADARRG